MSTQEHTSHGELKREIATQIGADPSRYAAGTGTERHKRLTAGEITAVASALGLECLEPDTRQAKINAIMLKLGRDHRVGTGMLDISDLRAILAALEGRDD